MQIKEEPDILITRGKTTIAVGGRKGTPRGPPKRRWVGRLRSVLTSTAVVSTVAVAANRMLLLIYYYILILSFSLELAPYFIFTPPF